MGTLRTEPGPLGAGAGSVVLTVLVTPGQELQVIDVVVVVARGAQNFKRQVSYDWRGSAKDDRTIHQRGLTTVATPQRRAYSLHD